MKTQTLIDDVEKYGAVACQALNLLFAAEGVSGTPTEILAGVQAILGAVKSGAAAKADPATIQAELAKFQRGTEADDAAAEALITQRFGVSK